MREGISCVSRERGYGAEINIVNNLLSYYLDICNTYIWQYKITLHYNSRLYSFSHSPYDHDLYYSCVWRNVSYHDDGMTSSYVEMTSSSLIVWTLMTYYDLSRTVWNGYALMVYMIVQIQETLSDSAQSAYPVQTY